MKFLFWAIYYPLIKFIGLFIFWTSSYRFRRKFEKQNISDPHCRSYRSQNLKADLCFEFSSEGEYQQVASLIDDALLAGKRLELVFFSPSVERTIMALAEKHPNQIRYLRYPLVSVTPWISEECFLNWVTASKLIIVRYDFLPEFLVWARGPGHELVILWASFKKERIKNKSISWFKKIFLMKASKVIYASVPDQELGAQLNLPGPCYDFRIEQIRRRLVLREEKFRSNLPAYELLKKNWQEYPKEKRLLFGNAWPSDLFLLTDLPKDLFILVIPHQLTEDILSTFTNELARLGRKVTLVNGEEAFIEGDTFVLNKKGVLCELYADFGLAYVGGGFEVSVHSILEPLVAGCASIACGKLHHRSTEFDVAHKLGRLQEVNSAKNFTNWINSHRSHPDEGVLDDIFSKYAKYSKEVISC
jgi:3-deoxy-D-manno-octulosonic-acid transferase